MKRLITALTFLVCLPVLAQTDDLAGEPGYVDFSAFTSGLGEPQVEVNIGRQLLGWFGKADDDPETQAIFNRLLGVRVYVYPLDDDADASVQRIKDTVSQLRASGWTAIVTVREDDETANVMVKMNGDLIEGLTVLAASAGDEMALINIIGQIRPDDLDSVMNKFDVDIGDMAGVDY